MGFSFDLRESYDIMGTVLKNLEERRLWVCPERRRVLLQMR